MLFSLTSSISFFLEIRAFTLLILYRCALLFYNVMYLLEINITKTICKWRIRVDIGEVSCQYLNVVDLGLSFEDGLILKENFKRIDMES